MNRYVYERNNEFGNSEFFLDRHVLNRDNTHSVNFNTREVTLENVIRKFEYLENLKSRGIYYPIKIIPKNVIHFGDEIENRFKLYLKDFKVLTILRNPFDSYLSRSFQDSIDWKVSHNKKDSGYSELKPTQFSPLITPENFIKQWLNESRFIFDINPHHIFKYEDINTKYLNNYFGFTINNSMKPMNINYKNLVINYNKVYDDFHFVLERKMKNWKNVFGVNPYNEDL